ncbi:DnaA ATPase domain-containing protein [Streptococcus salivarius]
MLEQLLKMHAEKIRVNSNSDEYQKVMKQIENYQVEKHLPSATMLYDILDKLADLSVSDNMSDDETDYLEWKDNIHIEKLDSGDFIIYYLDRFFMSISEDKRNNIWDIIKERYETKKRIKLKNEVIDTFVVQLQITLKAPIEIFSPEEEKIVISFLDFIENQRNILNQNDSEIYDAILKNGIDLGVLLNQLIKAYPTGEQNKVTFLGEGFDAQNLYDTLQYYSNQHSDSFEENFNNESTKLLDKIIEKVITNLDEESIPLILYCNEQETTKIVLNSVYEKIIELHPELNVEYFNATEFEDIIVSNKDDGISQNVSEIFEGIDFLVFEGVDSLKTELAKKELIKLTKWLQNKGQQVLFSSFVRPENIEMFISEDIISDGHIIDITTREVAV